MKSCIVKDCNNTAVYNHRIHTEDVYSCEEHYDQVWLAFKNAYFDVLAIIEELHWKVRNLDAPIKGGEEG